MLSHVVMLTYYDMLHYLTLHCDVQDMYPSNADEESGGVGICVIHVSYMCHMGCVMCMLYVL